MEDSTVFRNISYRLVPGTKDRAKQLSILAGACRFVWNHILADQQRRYREYLDTEVFCETSLLGLLFERPAKPGVSFFDLGKRFTALRRQTPWLAELPFAPVRHSLKYQAEAWKRAFTGGGFPKFKARRGDDSFTIPQDVKIRNGKLWVPKLGWFVLRRSGGNPHEGCKAVQAVVKRVLGRWYCTVCYEVPDTVRPHNGIAVGLDSNCGQVAASDGRVFRLPNTARLEARKRRYQRMMAQRIKGSNRRAKARHLVGKTSRKIAMIRADWQHQVSRELADSSGSIVIEALKTKDMTRSAKGTAENPGTNVRAKAGLNRAILATGWSGLKQKLDYKAAELIEVNPAYTSQTCSLCGHCEKASRRSQSKFQCVACGHTANADINAALNILALGTGAAGRRGAWALAPPMNRQNVSLGVAA